MTRAAAELLHGAVTRKVQQCRIKLKKKTAGEVGDHVVHTLLEVHTLLGARK